MASSPGTRLRQILLPRDHYVRMDSNDYSVHPAAIGRRIEVVADLERVRVLLEGQVVADHARIWARHQSVADPAHVAAASSLRTEHRAAQLRSDLRGDEQVQLRHLGDYDAAFGLHPEVA